MVNILICTFIFGLGDDYCIFTSDGILERYKTGKDHTRANRDAVILTGITTLLGTGALLFAEHPALRSIATLSVIGMVCILVIALTVQPWLYRTFITGRAVSDLQIYRFLRAFVDQAMTVARASLEPSTHARQELCFPFVRVERWPAFEDVDELILQ